MLRLPTRPYLVEFLEDAVVQTKLWQFPDFGSPERQIALLASCLERATAEVCHPEPGPTFARGKRAQNVAVGTGARDPLFGLFAPA